MIKNFWLYAAIFLFFVFGLLGISIWQTDKTSSFNKQAANSSYSSASQSQHAKASSGELSANAPAPAKKLQKLLDDAEQPLTVDAELQEKIQILDNTLADIDAELHTKGLSTSDLTATKTTPVAPDTQARLQNIKNHLKNKQQ